MGLCPDRIGTWLFWLGGLGYSASHGPVMARLITHGQDYGIHPFIVQLHDMETGKPMDGVDLGGVGSKMAQNQTDNGYARFENVVAARENMLMGQAEVSRDGEYTKKASTHSKTTYRTINITHANITIDYGHPTRNHCHHYNTLLDYTPAGLPGRGSRPKSRHSYGGVGAAARDFEHRQATGDFRTTATLHALTAGMKAWPSTAAMAGAEDARNAPAQLASSPCRPCPSSCDLTTA
ncbi:hypothetical protein DL767_009975 [Monosporascus sp. MG133]|nr:hypothetical protein DL767_009975 [Monosporascus sp. MG133]